MPLLSPNQITPTQINKVLKVSGIRPQSETLKELLEENGVSGNDVIAVLGEVMRGADTSATRLKAAELGMKLHGLLSESGPQAPVVNIIIGGETSVNPILIPR